MKSSEMWHGTLGLALLSIFFGIVGFIAYLLYGPPVPSWPFGNAPETAVVETTRGADLSNDEGTLLRCDEGKFLKAAFSSSGVRLALSDGRRISLPQIVSTAGTYYANTDESFVFWNTGTNAFVGEGGSVTYSRCAAPQE